MTTETAGVGEAQFRVPKVTVDAEFLLEGGPWVAGKVFLFPDAGTHGGRERVIDLLRARESFFPATFGGKARLVNKARLLAVRVAEAADAGVDEELVTAFISVPVMIELAGVGADENALGGVLHLETAPGHHRLLDYLNAVGEFVPLEQEAGIVLVATRAITGVRPL